MKKMVKVILVCTAVLCAIDQIMRFTGPYAIAHIWNDMVLDGNYAAADAINAKINSKYCKRVTRKYLKSLQTVSPALVKR